MEDIATKLSNFHTDTAPTGHSDSTTQTILSPPTSLIYTPSKNLSIPTYQNDDNLPEMWLLQPTTSPRLPEMWRLHRPEFEGKGMILQVFKI